MLTQILTTKLHRPTPRRQTVSRARLLRRLEAGVDGKLTLVSAAAGFGKTTAVTDWLTHQDRQTAWLSLDAQDSDLNRFLTYVVATLQTVAPQVGQGVLQGLASPQPPPAPALLTALLNQLAELAQPLVLVLDDYQRIENPAIDEALTFFLDHLPPQLHLIVITREDPSLPLARWRGRGQLNELRAADLRFLPEEVATYLNEQMELTLSADSLAALHTRTEGWIAGLHLAALSLQKRSDPAQFITAFSGSHRFIFDYLIEEVLHHHPPPIRQFLVQTSILGRMCPALCDAVTGMSHSAETLRYLEQNNLFIVPLDTEEEWFRYHHLFAEFLQKQLSDQQERAALHRRAGDWYLAHGFELEAFEHAVQAEDVAQAVVLLEGGGGNGMPLHLRGGVQPALRWLKSLPADTMNAHPTLWVIYASALLFGGVVEDVLRLTDVAEAALDSLPPGPERDDWLAHVASIRASVAFTADDVETMAAESERALRLASPQNVTVRTAATWSLGVSQLRRGHLDQAKETFRAAIKAGQAIGHRLIQVLALLGLAEIQRRENHYPAAIETYRQAIALAGEPPLPIAGAAHLGLATIAFEQGALEPAETHAKTALELTRQLEHPRFAEAAVLLSHILLAQHRPEEALAPLTSTHQQLLAHGWQDKRVEQLLAQLTDLPAPAPQSQPLIEPLTPRELEVLQLIAAGNSNDQIAAQLFLSLNTVKGHNRRIFDKLEVNRRTEAVARARQLGLLPGSN